MSIGRIAACASFVLVVAGARAAGPPPAAAPALGVAAPRVVEARVAWSRGPFVYLEADSGLLRPGTVLTFMRGNRAVAGATVDRVLEARVTRARLASGSLEREKRPERLRVLAADPPDAFAGALRVGVPSRERGNLLFACGTLALEPRLAGSVHDVDTLARGHLRLRRSPPRPGDGAPDTIVVRFFPDVADQEIALERGELDVAVFWPGEGSPRLRADPRFQGAPLGLRNRGVVAVVGDPSGRTRADPAALAAVNREVFGGDLRAWDQLEITPPDTTRTSVTAAVASDPALPGARVMDRVLARWGTPRGRGTLQLAFLDVPVAAGDAVSASWRVNGLVPVFAVRCPVLVARGARPAVAALGGPDAMANLLRCGVSAP